MECTLLKKWIVFINLFCCFSVLQLQAQIATIGAGTDEWVTYNPVSVGSYSFGEPIKNVHIQMIYTAAEIIAGGVTGPKMLDSIAWEVASLPAKNLKGYTIKLKNTPWNGLDSFISTNLTQVVSLPTFMPVKGWSWIKFQTPFYWNGVDNILLDFCTDIVSDTIPTGIIFTSYSDGSKQWISETSAKPLCGVYTGVDAYVEGTKANIKMSFRTAPACSGTPITGMISPATPVTGCSEMNVFLELNNPPQNGVKIQWQRSVDGGTWANVPADGNWTGYLATILASASYIDYRVQMTCAASSQSSTSNVSRINRSGVPYYAKLPYFQDFENWTSKCAIKDVPDSCWSSWPATGISSWRREDEGATADWQEDVLPNYYHPVSSEKAHSARFQVSKVEKKSGNLNLYLNCDGLSNNEMRFDCMNKTLWGAYLFVLMSKDGGTIFDTLATIDPMGVSAQWQHQVVPFNSSSATTVIRFVAYGASYQSGDFDLGIDNLNIYPTCQEKPTAGTVDSLSTCKGEGIMLSLSGTSKSGGLNWLWQETKDGIRWTDVPGGAVEHPSTSIDEDTWFRCVVTCSKSGQSDTSAPQLIVIQPFYYCYCSSSSTVASPYINIGNVQLGLEAGGALLLDNGNPLPPNNNLAARDHHSDFTSLPPVDLFRDSSYKAKLTFFTENGAWAWPVMSEAYSMIYIDYNRNGEFDDNEKVWSRLKDADIYADSGVFKIPLTAEIGITGMRIVTNTDIYDTTLIKVCGPYDFGETEDYLVRIGNIPCNGTEAPGLITASDTSYCPGYPFILLHSGADSTSGLLSSIWQSSADGTNWSDIAQTNQRKEIKQHFDTPVYYRIKFSCGQNNTVFYSDSIHLSQDALCYCPSFATGGFSGMADSSDFGSFKLEAIHLPLTGGHLNNSLAVHKYNSYTHLQAPLLYVDSTYNFSLDHILLRNDHADAKITVFIDYNANGVYDIPAEHVYSAISGSSSWHKTGDILIPSDAVVDKETGMRLIVNNDTAANVPSDEACGTYVSGETADYRVIFKKGTEQVGVDKVSSLENSIHIFPNPSTGMVSLAYKGVGLNKGIVKIQNVAGQVLEVKVFNNLSGGSAVLLDLNDYSKGLYFISLEAEGYTYSSKVVLQ